MIECCGEYQRNAMEGRETVTILLRREPSGDAPGYPPLSCTGSADTGAYVFPLRISFL